MKPIIEINNGRGWNHYQGLRNLRMPREVRALLKSNKVDALQIEPLSNREPLGIIARFQREDTSVFEIETAYALHFDQNATGEEIRAGVLRSLNEGIDFCAARAQQHRILRLDATAQAKGFPNHAALEEFNHLQSKARANEREAFLSNPSNAKLALIQMVKALYSCSAVRMTRTGKLLDAKEQQVGFFPEVRAAIAWLTQNGYRSSIDDRHHFFDYVNNLSQHEKLRLIAE